MKIYATTKKFPGGMMIAPLLLRCVINTFTSQTLETEGSTTGLLENGTSTLVGLFIPCSSATTNFKQAGMSFCKGTILTVLKYIIGVLTGWGLNRVLGSAGILGLAPLAVTTAVTDSNDAVCIALAKEFGDSTDVGTTAILPLNNRSFLTVVALGATGLTGILLISIIAVAVPLFIGMFLRNVDKEFKMLLTNGFIMLPPFSRSALGTNISLTPIVKAGVDGVVLGLVTVVCTGVPIYYVYSAIHHGSDPMDTAIGTTGGNAAVMPVSAAMTDPSLNPAVEVAIVQVAASVVISAIPAPLPIGYSHKKAQKRQVEASDK